MTATQPTVADQLREAGAIRVGVNRHTRAGMDTLAKSTALIKQLTPEAVKAGMSKRDVAELVGVSYTQLFNILNAPADPTDDAGADVELQRQRAARKLAADVRKLAAQAHHLDRDAQKLLEQAARKLAR